MTKEYKELKVTMEVSFLIPMCENGDTKINGWTIEEVIEDWFGARRLNGSHRTRDAQEIGGSKKIIKTQLVSIGE